MGRLDMVCEDELPLSLFEYLDERIDYDDAHKCGYWTTRLMITRVHEGLLLFHMRPRPLDDANNYSEDENGELILPNEIDDYVVVGLNDGLIVGENELLEGSYKMLVLPHEAPPKRSEVQMWLRANGWDTDIDEILEYWQERFGDKPENFDYDNDCLYPLSRWVQFCHEGGML